MKITEPPVRYAFPVHTSNEYWTEPSCFIVTFDGPSVQRVLDKVARCREFLRIIDEPHGMVSIELPLLLTCPAFKESVIPESFETALEEAELNEEPFRLAADFPSTMDDIRVECATLQVRSEKLRMVCVHKDNSDHVWADLPESLLVAWCKRELMCPRCGSSELTELETWAAVSPIEPARVETLLEQRCNNCSHTFWT